MHERRESFLVACGILVFLLFFGVAYTHVTATAVVQSDQKTLGQIPDSCTGCHEIVPEILTWQISSHSKFACTECHDVKMEDYRLKHDSQHYEAPIRITDAIPNTVCEKCHTSSREATVSGDLIIPHDKHAAAGVACVKCHSGVVHAKIADRGLTVLKNENSVVWDIEKAKQIATNYYLQPSMWTCISCHKQAGITRQCSACHTSIPGLPSHEQPSWKAEHGKVARVNIGECTKCHATPGTPHFITPSTGDLAADFARAQEYCYNCHLQRPEMHEKSMVQVHPEKAAARGSQNCLTCHDREQPKEKGTVAETHCNNCHWQKDN